MSKSIKRSLILLSFLTFSASVGIAEPGHGSGTTSTAEKKKPEMNLNFSISSNSVTSNHKIENSNQWSTMMQSYPAQQFFKRIQGLPGIENIHFTPGKHVVDESHFDKDVVHSDRESSLMVRVQGAAPFSMLFKVEETLSRCKTMVSGDEEEDLNKWGSPDWSDSLVDKKVPCRMESSMKITGPVAVYGTIPGNFANRALLLNQITLSWALKTSFNREDTELNSSFRTNRADFPVAVRKMLKWTMGNNTPYAEMFFENPHRNALVQIGRVLREKNQEILRGM